MGSSHPPLGCSGWPRPVWVGCCVWCSGSFASGNRGKLGSRAAVGDLSAQPLWVATRAVDLLPRRALGGRQPVLQAHCGGEGRELQRGWASALRTADHRPLPPTPCRAGGVTSDP